jgi:hypothetical protein
MPRGERTCPNCKTESSPWVFHAGVWWTRYSPTSDWQWHDSANNIWRWYSTGMPSSADVTNGTPNLFIDPAAVSPPDESALTAPTGESVAEQVGIASTPSTAAELERLEALHERGSLTDDAFQAAKARLLSS